MGTTNFILIVVAEALALCLFIIAIQALKNRKLQKLIQRLHQRLEEAVKQLRLAKTSNPADAPETTQQPSDKIAYQDYLNQHIELTRNHHEDLGSTQDIALDLDPDMPTPRRTAALRHAYLVAEREATTEDGSEVDWDKLNTRLQQILLFNQDYSPQEEVPPEALEHLQQELEQAQKRISNLERFKNMYFELEEEWEKCKAQADGYYAQLQAMADNSGNKEDFEELMASYQNSYQSIDALIERGTLDHSSGTDSETQKLEIQRLREVAADQHRIITELQQKLSSSLPNEDKLQLVAGMQNELEKQARFLRESETCIRLMEDELNNANHQIDMLKSRAVLVPQLKSALADLQRNTDTREQVLDSLKQENRKLNQKLKAALEGPQKDSTETASLRKELVAMRSKYNELEEKFLNLKLKG